MSTVNLSSCIWRKSSQSDSSGAECVEVASVPSNWQKSSHSDSSGEACIEVASMMTSSDAGWQKSRRSTDTGHACVEVADLTAAVAVRDSKDPDGPKLILGPSAWQTFASQVKTGDLDLP